MKRLRENASHCSTPERKPPSREQRILDPQDRGGTKFGIEEISTRKATAGRTILNSRRPRRHTFENDQAGGAELLPTESRKKRDRVRPKVRTSTNARCSDQHRSCERDGHGPEADAQSGPTPRIRPGPCLSQPIAARSECQSRARLVLPADPYDWDQRLRAPLKMNPVSAVMEG